MSNTASQRTTIHQALRLLGNPMWSFRSRQSQVFGLKILAIHLGTTSPDLNEISRAADSLAIEESLR